MASIVDKSLLAMALETVGDRMSPIVLQGPVVKQGILFLVCVLI